MGLIKWFQKKGSTGSIARWVFKQYQLLRSQNADLDYEKIVEIIFNKRYSTFSPKRTEKERFDEIKEKGETTGYYSVRVPVEVLSWVTSPNDNSELFTSIHALCMGILYIEMNINPFDPFESKLYEQTSQIITEELKRLGLT